MPDVYSCQVNKFLSCNYKAPGNYQGQFAANVGRKTA